MASSDTALIVVGGGGFEPELAEALPAPAFVVAADSGLDLAHARGIRVDLAIGDFDSVSVEGLARAEAEGVRIERHPAAKDQTDLELALGAVLSEGATRVVVLGGDGGRLDHTLANALVLASPRYEELTIDAVFGAASVLVVRDRRRFQGEVGELVTLLAAHGPAEGVVTEGLLYVLAREDLAAGSSRGLSNQLIAPEATVSVEAGTLLVIRPGEQGPPLP
jgi:thiamine pyrophosphokinase